MNQILVIVALAACIIPSVLSASTASSTACSADTTSTFATHCTQPLTAAANCVTYSGSASSPANTGRHCANPLAGYFVTTTSAVADSTGATDDTLTACDASCATCTTSATNCGTCATGYAFTSGSSGPCTAITSVQNTVPTACGAALASTATGYDTIDANCATPSVATNCLLYAKSTTPGTVSTGRHCLVANSGFYVFSTVAAKSATATVDDVVCSTSCDKTVVGTTSAVPCDTTTGLKCYGCATGYSAPSGTTAQTTTPVLCTASFGEKVGAVFVLLMVTVIALIL